MSCVLDASVVLAWLLPDEQSDAATALIARVAHERPQAPMLLRYEVANALLHAGRRGRVVAASAQALLEAFESLPIAYESPGPAALTSSLALARHHRLSIYDAAYLELAMRRSFRLATFDARLQAAADAEKVVGTWERRKS